MIHIRLSIHVIRMPFFILRFNYFIELGIYATKGNTHCKRSLRRDLETEKEKERKNEKKHVNQHKPIMGQNITH